MSEKNVISVGLDPVFAEYGMDVYTYDYVEKLLGNVHGTLSRKPDSKRRFLSMRPI